MDFEHSGFACIESTFASSSFRFMSLIAFDLMAPVTEVSVHERQHARASVERYLVLRLLPFRSIVLKCEPHGVCIFFCGVDVDIIGNCRFNAVIRPGSHSTSVSGLGDATADGERLSPPHPQVVLIVVGLIGYVVCFSVFCLKKTFERAVYSSGKVCDIFSHQMRR